jgi:N-succinyldiaminopimelate aminotransferase
MEHQYRCYSLEPEDVLITFGATEAIAAALLALLDPGDEVVVLEPFYDSYAAGIAFAGAARSPVACARRTSRSTPMRCEQRSPVVPR